MVSDLPAGPIILVDADACPVKEEVYKVAWRHDVPVRIVSNQRLRVPEHPLIERVTVSRRVRRGRRLDRGAGAARRGGGDRRHPARRPLPEGGRAAVIAPNGRPFTAASIGGAIATRAIMADLRAGLDGLGGGPAPFAKADRSRFLSALDEALVRAKRG